MIIKHQRENISVFTPKEIVPKASLNIPAKILKAKAKRHLKIRLAKTTQIKRRSGLTLNILKYSKTVACRKPETTIMDKKIQFLMG
jgi:hypothetical protein